MLWPVPDWFTRILHFCTYTCSWVRAYILHFVLPKESGIGTSPVLVPAAAVSNRGYLKGLYHGNWQLISPFDFSYNSTKRLQHLELYFLAASFDVVGALATRRQKSNNNIKVYKWRFRTDFDSNEDLEEWWSSFRSSSTIKGARHRHFQCQGSSQFLWKDKKQYSEKSKTIQHFRSWWRTQSNRCADGDYCNWHDLQRHDRFMPKYEHYSFYCHACEFLLSMYHSITATTGQTSGF